MSEWKPTEQHRPERGEWVLIHSTDAATRLPSVAYLKRCDSEDGVFAGQDVFCDDESYYPMTTHWMPLPEPPHV